MSNNITSMHPYGNPFSDPNMPHAISMAKAQRVARSVSLITHLPGGDALVPVLGDGTEPSNLAALATWIQRTYPAVATLAPADQVAGLAARLRAYFEDWGSEAFS